MSEPLRIRFATDAEGAKKGMQDLAASVVSNMVKLSGAVAQHSEAASAAAGKLTSAFGTGAQGVAKAATTIASDVGAIGAAGIKAANDSNVSAVAIGAAVAKAAAQTQTGSVVSQAAVAALSAKVSFTYGVIKNEVAQTTNVLMQSPLFLAALPIATALAGVVAGFALVTAAENAAKASLEEYVKIATQARDLGVGSGFLQRWTAQAKELNVEVAKLEGMLANARDASAIKIGEDGGKGKADNGASSAIGDRLEQNVRAGNLSRSDLASYNDAQSAEAKYRVVLNIIEQLQAKGAQLAALDLGGKMFGPEFERQARAGVDIVGKMREALDSTATTVGGNRIISDEELRNAQAIDTQLERIRSTMAEGLAPIQRDLVALGQDSYRSWLDIEEAIAKAVRAAGALYTEVSKILAELDKITGKDPLASLATTLGAPQLGKFIFPPLGMPPAAEVQGPPVPASGLPITVNPKKDTSRSLPSLRGATDGTESKDEIERLIDQLGKANELAKAELETVGLTNVEREKALALAKLTAAARAAGRDATDDERAKVDQLSEATARLKDRTMDQQQALRQNAEAMREFGQIGVDAISDMLLEGKSLDDVFANLTKQIARMALQAAILGTGPLAGLFGTSAPASQGSNALGGVLGLFGNLFKGSSSANTIASDSAALLNVPIGFNAGGTDDWRGGLSVVGERGPEIVNLPRGAQVIPNMRIPSLMSGGGISLSIGGAVIDARGADAGIEARLRAALAESNRVQAAQLSAMIRDRRSRGAI